MSLLLLAALGWLVAWLLTADEFFVDGLTLRGNEVVSAEEIYRQSRLDGMNIFLVNTGWLEEAIAQIPAVKAARVRCRLPNRVIVEVEERRAEIVWQVGEARYLVDAEGMVLPAKGEPDRALIIEDLEARPVRPGDRVDPEAIEAAHRLSSLLPEVRVFEYSRAEGMSFTNERGWRVRLGMSDDLEAKVATLKALSQRIIEKGIHVELIDLRFKGSSYYR